MNIKYLVVLAVFALWFAPLSSSGQTNNAESSATSPKASDVESTINELRAEINTLNINVEKQAKKIDLQKKTIDDIISNKQKNLKTTVFTAVGVVIAALIAGFFALQNQNKQAAQERLLKAIEIIMDSSNGYQADIRKRNLEVFLDEATKNHLRNIGKEFSGPEFTDLSISLAQAMSEKANNSKEVLNIWKSVLKGKTAITRVVYPENEQESPTQHKSET